MKTNRKQEERIEKLYRIIDDGCYRFFDFLIDNEIFVIDLLEDFVTDRFLIPENSEVETIINTPESYFDMLIDFLEFIDNYNIPNEK